MKRLHSTEYIILLALLVSIGAMGSDLMLPALDQIGRALAVGDPNDVQFIVSVFFLGMGVGQIFAGPLSDRFGRKPVIYVGYGVFIAGCLLSMVTESWAVMLAARFLQGLGAAAPRSVAVAMVRDEHEGRAMARIMSIVMAVFILVPITAPALGQGLIYLGGWRSTFLGLSALAILVTIWFALRQPETLSQDARRALNLSEIWRGIREIISNRTAFGYTLATGLIYGMFVGYLSSSQQIFQDVFQVGDMFAMYFALGAAAVGGASLVNAKLVMGLGMRRLTWSALLALTALSFAFWATLTAYGGIPSLALFLGWQMAAFFCVGIMFGNLTALSLEPLGHMAGLGAAFVGAFSNIMSLPLAWVIGSAFDGTVYPLTAGFALLGLAAVGVMWMTERNPKPVH